MTGSEIHDTTNLLNAIARSAEAFGSGAGWPEGMDTLLAELGAVTGVSRVWVFQVVDRGEDYIVQDYVAEWASQQRFKQLHLKRLTMFRTEAADREYWTMHEARKKGGHHSMAVKELPESRLKSFLEGQGILSMLTVPVMVGGRQWGVLGLDDCEREYRWSGDEVALMRTAASILANSVLVSRVKARQKQFDILKRFTDCLAWELDLKRMLLWISDGRSDREDGRELFLTMRKAFRMVHPGDRSDLVRAVNAHIASGERTFRYDARLFDMTKKWVWMEIIGSLDRNERGEVLQFAGIAVDISERKQQEMELLEKAALDPLTGVPNRRAFEEGLAVHTGRAAAGEMKLSVLLIDFDRFKEINDTWGHKVGDMVLKQFVSICMQSLRDGDMLARLGGEEFVVILPGAGKSSAVRVGERIRASVEDLSLLLDTGKVGFTISIGCATWGDTIREADDLLEAADKALYEAKRTGRNRLVSYGEPVLN